MSLLNSKERYGTIAIALHWLTLLVMVAMFASVELHENYPKGDPMRSLLMTWHFQLGLTVLLLTIVRLLVKVRSVDPDIKPALTHGQKLASKAMHLALYLILVVMPIAGFIGRTLAGKVTYFFGLALPVVLGVNEKLAENIFDIHSVIGNTAYFLIAAHAAAAIYHHHFQKDNTLTRMLPERK